MAMETIGYAELPIMSLKLPGDFRARLEAPHVIELGESMGHVGQLHEPVVRAADKMLISGGDRVAAHMARGLDKVFCKLVDCTDADAELARLDENLRRRHDPEKNARDEERRIALLAAMEARKLKEAKKNGAPAPNLTPSGRAQKPEVTAREKIARRKGVKASSIARMQRRARKAKAKREKAAKIVEAQEKGVPVDTAPISPIDDLGFELGAEWLGQVSEVKRLLGRATELAQQVMSQLTQIGTKQLPFSPARLQRLHADAKALGAALRAELPKSLCPYCKGQQAYQDKCTACAGHGYITESQMNHVPEQLWKPDVVSVDGALQALEIEQSEPEQPAEEEWPLDDEVAGDLGKGW